MADRRGSCITDAWPQTDAPSTLGASLLHPGGDRHRHGEVVVTVVKLSPESFERPADIRGDDPAALYARSYLLIRTVVGAVGVALPSALMLMDWFFLRGSAHVRGSLSAYYFTSARDLFVGSLFVIGALLITYMAGRRDTWDFWLSFVAGWAVIGVALLPTERPDVPAGAPRCGATPVPEGCTGLQQYFGEQAVAATHFVLAGVFILGLAAMCFLFARRALRHDGNVRRARLFQVCGGTILAAVAWILLGGALHEDIAGLTPLYVGEVVSVYAFGLCWFVTGHDLWRLLIPGRAAAPVQTT